MIIVIWALGPTATYGLAAYDCEHPSAKQEIIDLTKPKECPDPERDFEPRVLARAQLLQTATDTPLTAYQCKVHRTKTVRRCGFNSIAYGGVVTAWQKAVPLEANDCRRAVHTGNLMLDGRLHQVKPGKVNRFTFFSFGGVDGEGNCETANFVSEGLAFRRSYERTELLVDLQTVHGTRDASSGTAFLTNGLRARFADGILRDAFAGTIVWNASVPDCEDTVSQVYTGPVELHRWKAGTKADLAKSIIMVENGGAGASGRYVGLVLRGTTTVCRYECYTTQIRGMVYCPVTADQAAGDFEFRANVETEQAWVQSQVGHTHLSNNIRMYNRFETVQRDLCETDRRVLSTRLQAAPGSHNPHSFNDFLGPGHSVQVAGAAAYVTRCVLVEAIKVDYRNCTLEIPVTVNGTLRFADPLSWVLRDIPVIVPCDSTAPVRWLLNGQWYCATPRTHRCQPPRSLEPGTTNFRDEDFTTGLGGSVYSDEQIREHRRAQRILNSKEAVNTKNSIDMITSGRTGSDGSIILGPPLTGDAVANIKEDVLGAIWFGLPNLGLVWHILTGTLIAFAIGKVFLGCLVRIYHTYQAKGYCGLWIFGAMWGTIFSVGMVLILVTRAIARFIDNPDPQQPEQQRARDELLSALKREPGSRPRRSRSYRRPVLVPTPPDRL